MPAALPPTRVSDSRPDWPAIHSFGDLLRSRARVFGAKPAFLWNGSAVSFEQVEQRVKRFNSALRKLGLEKGDRVAILSRNRPEFFEIYGVAAGGFVSVPLNWRLSPAELLHPLKDSRPSVIVAEAGFTEVVDALRADLPSLRHFIALGEAPLGWSAYEQVLQGAPECEWDGPIHADDPVCIT